MVKKYPDLERGESAGETGRTHIPPRIVKQATKLNRLEQKLRELLSSINPLNAKKVTAEILQILDDYIPGVAELSAEKSRERASWRDRHAQKGSKQQQTQRPAPDGTGKKGAGTGAAAAHHFFPAADLNGDSTRYS